MWPIFARIVVDGQYLVSGQAGDARVLVGWSKRQAWDKLRVHAVVFKASPEGSKYPWVEFLETDDGDYASGIPDPEKPSKVLKDGDKLPLRFNSARVARSD